MTQITTLIMDPKLRDFIDNSKLHRGMLRQLMDLLPDEDGELDALIGEAVASHDTKAFIMITVGALIGSRPVDSRHLSGGTTLFVHAEWMHCLVWKMQGEVAQHLVEGARVTAMEQRLHATALLIAAAWSIEFRGGQQPPDLIIDARLLVRASRGHTDNSVILLALAQLLDDAHFTALLAAEHPQSHAEECIARARVLALATVNLGRFDVLALVPAKPDDLIGAGPNVRRAVARTGRNDPCPCGSGKKYKRCCFEKDQGRMRFSSQVAGKTRAEVFAQPEPHLTEAKLKMMLPQELARLDATKMPPKLMGCYLTYLGAMFLLDECAATFEKLGCETPEMEAVWDFVMTLVIVKQRADIARRLMQVRYQDGPVPVTLNFGIRLLLACDDPAQMLKELESGAREALISKSTLWLSEFIHGLMGSPLASVGIHCARSFIPLIGTGTAIYLVEEIQRARDRLNLPPDEPFGEILVRRFAEEVVDDGKDAEELRQAYQRLEKKAGEVSQLKESMEKLRRDIRLQQKKEKAPAAGPADAAAETPEMRDLREKVRTLKSSIQERNNERATFRSELGKAYADLKELRDKQSAAPAPNAAEAADAEDALLLPGELEGNQPPRIIEFPRRFNDTLDHLPRQIGRAALVLLGRIAAGDATAFTGAIRLKLAPDVMRVRIGLDHRMLFRLLPDRVQLVDLINRRDLERCIAGL